MITFQTITCSTALAFTVKNQLCMLRLCIRQRLYLNLNALTRVALSFAALCILQRLGGRSIKKAVSMGKHKVVNIQTKEQLKAGHRLAKILGLMPENVQNSFTDEQLKNLKVAVTASSRKKHTIDIRSVISLFSYRYYYVIIAGREQREMSRREVRLKRLMYLLFLSLFLTFSALLGILVLYLLKSAIGIDIFPDFSFGVWRWFKMTFLDA